ncbi:MAG: glutathione S-transferase family protein [Candidatus Binatia bacterium]
MIKLYTSATPNGRKISIALEELGLEYETVVIRLDEGQSRTPQFLAMNPNGKIPVLEDDGQVLWESGATLVHLAEKYGSLLPADPIRRTEALTLMFFQAAHVGPNLGRLGEQFYKPAEEQNAEMLQLFMNESQRVFAVLDTVLKDGREYLVGEFSIADAMIYPWLAAAREAASGFFDELDGLRAWMDRVAARPAVARGMSVPE